MHQTLETERLILRGWQRGDAADLFEYAKNPSMAMGGWEPLKDIRQAEQMLESFIEEGDR